MNTQLTVAKEKLDTIGAMLEKRKDMLAQILPRHIRPERLIKVALMAINRQPALLDCTPASLFQALMLAGQLGLEPDGVLGSAYLIPYGKQATLIPGYRGLIDLARRSGQIKSIEAHLIRKNDKFECAFGLSPVLTHSPVFPGDQEYLKNEHIIGAYAVAKLVDGGEQFEVMSRAEIDAIRGRSKASGSGPWVTDYGEMARKTVVRRLVKYLPISVELSTALEADNRADTGVGIIDLINLPAEVLPQEEIKTATESLAERTRQTRSDKGKSRTKETTSPPPEQAPIMGGTAPQERPHSERLIDSDTVAEIESYCQQLGQVATDIPKRFNVNRLNELTNHEAGIVMGELLEQMEAAGLT